ncbi:MAG: antibiotic biosynthesis monooxygenase [Gammaproteobacteria bacterium]|nr:antibiotic biosynthesis monooxygenase [Gammaproteobacteria bacterium]
MSKECGFCVIYRFKIRPGAEDMFRQGWIRMTEAIRDGRGGLGSRLHLSDDGWWLAYAQWPDRQTWERSGEMEAADPAAARMMAESVEERLPPILLEATMDLLVR